MLPQCEALRLYDVRAQPGLLQLLVHAVDVRLLEGDLFGDDVGLTTLAWGDLARLTGHGVRWAH